MKGTGLISSALFSYKANYELIIWTWDLQTYCSDREPKTHLLIEASVIKLKIQIPSSEWCGIQLCGPARGSLTQPRLGQSGGGFKVWCQVCRAQQLSPGPASEAATPFSSLYRGALRRPPALLGRLPSALVATTAPPGLVPPASATARIGDPSGKSVERPLLSDEELGKLKGNEKNSIIFIKRR